ncbi:major facilitator super transporter protein [Spiromyces aspiralis]|uniref:Major facilitator super transporter protein n=1 Tax=Spiromyces aspiralis TaxID=68401 RepID=A0ACC1HU66_9FUNG|nr:major facilitator super transporter protein [Spiromyces aspiralis]
MPRLKALTTGTVPSFLDAILNIAESDTSSSLAHYDNILWQLKHNGGKRIVMFGDDTWLRLFPDIFSRIDGTSSFFVTDTVEVDLNVTRNVHPELTRDDWEVAIFHYLGLDHIGHLGGPDSPMMGPKQQEMDAVIKEIYSIITEQDTQRMKADSRARPTLFVLMGDHGMNDAGNHGGSSLGEVSTALVFTDIGMRAEPIPDDDLLAQLLNRRIPQVNFASTVSVLFGVPIPRNNLGYPVMELLERRSDEDKLRSLQACTHQIYRLIVANSGGASETAFRVPSLNQFKASDISQVLGTMNKARYLYARALDLHAQFLAGGVRAVDAVQAYQEALELASAHLASTFSNYNFVAILSGTGIMVAALGGYVCLQFWRTSGGGGSSSSQRLCLWTVGSLACYVCSMFATSNIEEEHQYWYFWHQTLWLAFLCTRWTWQDALAPLGQVVLLRIIRSWNQTGIKWAGSPDLRHYLTVVNPQLGWAMFGATLVVCNFAIAWTILFNPSYWNGCDNSNSSSSSSGRDADATTAETWGSAVREKDGGESRRAALAGVLSRKRARAVSMKGKAFLASFCASSILVFVYKVEMNQAWDIVAVPKAAFGWLVPASLVGIAWTVYALAGAGVLMALYSAFAQRRRAATYQAKARLLGSLAIELAAAILPVLLLLIRHYNAPLFILYSLQLALFTRCISSARPPPGHAACLALFAPSPWLLLSTMHHASFYALGNSNSLASLDLSNAYAGVTHYNEVLVGILLFISNWAGPIWFSLGWIVVITRLAESLPLAASSLEMAGSVVGSKVTLSNNEAAAALKHRIGDLVVQSLTWTHGVQSVCMLALSVAITVHREHLFVWTVFAPKYLYQAAWFMFFYLGTFSTLLITFWAAASLLVTS